MSEQMKLEGTHRVRTHAVLLLTLTVTLNFDLSTQNHVTCRISQGHSLYQVWTLWGHSFLSYAADKQTERQRDKQTNKQTDSKILPTPTDIVGVSNKRRTQTQTKGKMNIDFYSAPIVRSSPLKRSGMDQTVVTLQTHHTCLYLVSVHQTAPPLASGSSHLIAAYYSFIDPREDERLSWPS